LTDTDKQNRTKNTQTEFNCKKSNNTKYSKSKLVVCYDTRPGNDMGLFYNAPEPTRQMHAMLKGTFDFKWRKIQFKYNT